MKTSGGKEKSRRTGRGRGSVLTGRTRTASRRRTGDDSTSATRKSTRTRRSAAAKKSVREEDQVSNELPQIVEIAVLDTAREPLVSEAVESQDQAMAAQVGAEDPSTVEMMPERVSVLDGMTEMTPYEEPTVSEPTVEINDLTADRALAAEPVIEEPGVWCDESASEIPRILETEAPVEAVECERSSESVARVLGGGEMTLRAAETVDATVVGSDMTVGLDDSKELRSKDVGWVTAARVIAECWKWIRQRVKVRPARKRLRVCETVSLGEKRFVAVIQVDDEQFLVGGSSSSVATLAKLEPSPEFAAMLRTRWAEDPTRA